MVDSGASSEEILDYLNNRAAKIVCIPKKIKHYYQLPVILKLRI